ncbi:N-acetylneuraminate synthase family protein [Rhodohalobacter barkolensis]|uniref:Polysaccharide biosynthesis protein n=1 Tax=Rhodohalobacter barkolensis TaxID=2053187 RepID=A0A2N0VGB5_9BACT|nr:N-acetylneuraminate synthase family protein [Rhodohalobacter barkolensis]PKD43232.1 polysaccharide biosynthesis protein [Rhodohalobacter barkolensis]
MNIQLTPGFTVDNFTNPYIIAEIGSNHNGDMDLARKIIDAAVKTGVHAVKFQSWTPQSLIAKEEYKANTVYTDDPKKHWGSLREMVEEYYLREEQHAELNEYCKSKGVDFCSTPFSEEEADLLMELDVPFFKVASMDINNLRLLRYLGNTGKPVILSTGMATMGEIEQAILTVEETGNKNIVLLHCVSVYPPEMETINLRNITTLQQAFGYPVGFSDHTIGSAIPLASIALGACLIEKHFTIDKDLPGWDHMISADPDEMKVITSESENIVTSLGSTRRVISEAEKEKMPKMRRSIVTSRSLKKGEIIQANDILFKRPGTGIAPDQESIVVGRKVIRNIDQDVVLRWDDFE